MNDVNMEWVKMKRACRKQIFIMLTALSFFITGCGKKAEEIEYITKNASEKDIHICIRARWMELS